MERRRERIYILYTDSILIDSVGGRYLPVRAAGLIQLEVVFVVVVVVVIVVTTD